ncbi:Fic family protein [Parafrankia elaeagni]|uniref:Fic family protein n=1 Tax=Parafrankia elaeagni TaxID=222534 RepID=UPI0004763C08|nr:Fic family protein [Parafrankia elaeagni]
MDRDRFERSPTGHLVKIVGTDGRTGAAYEHVAFQPDPLADAEPSLAGGTWRDVARAGRALGRLDQAGRQIPEPALLLQPTLRTEAQSTSALEGTFAPLEDVLAAEVTELASQSEEVREVLNYVRAAEAAFAWIGDGRPLTVTALCRMHRDLVRGTPADTRDAGRIRSIQVAIGSRGGAIETARFVPPPPGLELDAAVRDLLDWINVASKGIDPVVAAAMAHYQFETLHPFNDGNGRIGRLLVVLDLCWKGILSEPLLAVSPWLEARREEYQDRLGEVSAAGDWDGWISFFAEGLAESCEQTIRTVDDLLGLQVEYVRRLKAAGLTGGLVRDVIDRLIGSPFITVRSVSEDTGRTLQAASNAVAKLVDLKILRERTGRSYGRVFEAVEVTSVLRGRPGR